MCIKKKPQLLKQLGLIGMRCLAVTYFRMGDPHYHRRTTVSLPSSGWDRVVHARYVHQANRFGGALKSAVTGLSTVWKSVLSCWISFLSTAQTDWVLYGQASRVISTR